MQKCNPTVPRAALLALAGGLWIAVGIMLLTLAGGWLRKCSISECSAFIAAGVAIALLMYCLAFVRIVNKNLKRIFDGEDRRCIFSFMPWSSYLVIPFMIALGFTLRHSPLPKLYLASLYIGIGLALLWSGVKYVIVFVREFRRASPEGRCG